MRATVLVVVGVAVGAGLAVWWMGRAQPDPVTPAATIPSEAAASSRPRREPMSLPALDDSDGVLRNLVGMLSRHPQLARLLATDDLVRGATLAVIQIGEGRTPVTPFEAIRPDSRVSIVGDATGRVDPESYARWAPATLALTSIDPAELAQVYVNVKPLFDEAYWEHGYPQGNFDDALVQGIGMLAATPDLTEDPVLIRRPDYFIHDSAALRDLEPVQKQFLLLGPTNRGLIMDWLRRFAAVLELPLD